ncbi:MAG: YtxH domain-containing protein [Microscillaceae bacterium]|jgi:gas vesicle protein|nr:YtxH domain-containing protein [Microscillaceae bacterium]
MDNNTKIFLGFLAGITAGVVAGILLAPEKGDRTRQLLLSRAKTQLGPQWDKANELAKSMGESLSEAIHDYSQKIFKKAKAEVDNEA